VNLAEYLRATLVGVALTLPPIPSSAENITGNELLRWLDDPRGFTQLGGLAYVSGAKDGMEISGEVCLPNGVSNGQVTKIVHKYLKENPAELHLPAVGIIYVSLGGTFPCDKKKR
jgi:hypothetical protein